jgi:hypothetical protein
VQRSGLFERLLVPRTEPVDINWAIKANNGINGTVWANGGFFPITPICDVFWLKLAKAVEANRNLTGKQRFSIEGAITGAPHHF